MAMGNTFNGVILEFPGLGVDKFNTEAEVFLLTHHHADHLVGLDRAKFNSRVYTSEANMMLMAHDERFRNVIHNFVGVPYNCPTEISYLSGKVTITFIPAYHCPGASMVMIEDLEKAVLCTGDIRAEKWWVDSLMKNPYIYPYSCGKIFDNIYIDTTFINRGEPFIDHMENKEAVDVIIELLKLYPQDDPEIKFRFADTTSGFEEVWAQVIQCFDGRLYTDVSLHNRLSSVLKNDFYHPYCDVLLRATKGNGPQFIIGEKSDMEVKICQFLSFNILDYAGVCLPIELQTLSPQEIQEIKEVKISERGNKLVEFRGRLWIWPINGTELLASDIKLPFSRHSSYSETRYFLQKIKCKQVYPCVSSKLTWESGGSMSRLFGDLCGSKDPRVYIYDTAMFKKYGELAKRPIKVIDRWNIAECQMEEKFVADYLKREPSDKIEFNFRGIGKLPDSWSSRPLVKSNLYALINGRTKESFKDIIMNQQYLYRDKHEEQAIEYGSYYDSDTNSSYDSIPHRKFTSRVLSTFQSAEMSFSRPYLPSAISKKKQIDTKRIEAFSLALGKNPNVWLGIQLESLQNT